MDIETMVVQGIPFAEIISIAKESKWRNHIMPTRHKIIITFILIISANIAFFPTLAYSAEVAKEGSGVIKEKINIKAKKYKKDTVVYIERVKGNFPPHGENAIMDQKSLVFIPHVLVVLKGTTVDYLNSDDVSHNVFSPDAIADKMNSARGQEAK